MNTELVLKGVPVSIKLDAWWFAEDLQSVTKRNPKPFAEKSYSRSRVGEKE